MIMFPGTGQGAVVMTSSDAGNEVMSDVIRSIAREYRWPAFQSVEKAAVALDPTMLRDAPGRYQGVLEGQTFFYTVEARDGGLTINTANWPAPRALHPASATRFFIRESEREYTFERDGSGGVVRIRVTGGGGPEIVAPRVPG
jgi:hypothetical protein